MAGQGQGPGGLGSLGEGGWRPDRAPVSASHTRRCGDTSTCRRGFAQLKSWDGPLITATLRRTACLREAQNPEGELPDSSLPRVGRDSDHLDVRKLIYYMLEMPQSGHWGLILPRGIPVEKLPSIPSVRNIRDIYLRKNQHFKTPGAPQGCWRRPFEQRVGGRPGAMKPLCKFFLSCFVLI